MNVAIDLFCKLAVFNQLWVLFYYFSDSEIKAWQGMLQFQRGLMDQIVLKGLVPQFFLSTKSHILDGNGVW